MASTSVFAPLDFAHIRTSVLHRWMTRGAIVGADLFALAAAGAMAVMIRYVFHARFLPRDYISFAPSILIFFAVFAFHGLYPGIATSPIEEFRLILRASSISFLLLIGSSYFLREGIFSSRIVFGLAWLLSIVLVPLCRRFARGWCSLQPWWGIPTVIIGERAAGVMMLDLLKGHPRVGLRPVALLLEQTSLPEMESQGNVFCGQISDANMLAQEYGDCYAVLAMPHAGSDRVTAILNEHAGNYRHILVIPDLFGIKSISVAAKDICGILALEVGQRLTSFAPQLFKRTFDLAVSVTVAILISPVLLILCAAVYLSSPGPIFYGQSRIGRDNQRFKVWKFRSMVVGADAVLKSHLDADAALREEWERDHKLKRDPRVTWAGRILRKTSLDELPQLWNVICGDMSLVGPRPIVQSEVEKYGQTFVQYQRVTPGVTGLWQISGRNNTTYDLRTRIDDYYVRNWSLSLDIYILFRTFKTIFFSEGAY
ncbi:MAG TPA: undecaprenyl-phosphate galactose phosphotransferase WbaP [Acidisarcina sp.]